MNRLPLESEILASVAYDKQQMVHLRCRGTGDVYRHFEFPVTEY